MENPREKYAHRKTSSPKGRLPVRSRSLRGLIVYIWPRERRGGKENSTVRGFRGH